MSYGPSLGLLWGWCNVLLLGQTIMFVLPGGLLFFVRTPGGKNYGSSLAHFSALFIYNFSGSLVILHCVPLKPAGSFICSNVSSYRNYL